MHQRVNREVETRDIYISSSMRIVYHHFRGRAVTIGIVGGWVRTHRVIQSANWKVVCYDLLGVILDNIYGGRIEMGWLRDTFPKPRNDSTEVERIRYARAYIFEMIGGYMMPDLSQNLVHLR
ncbi:hypothetical protein Goshw_029150 [Gossypium schwendimanii]|uniref:Uncharacterized protein n=2 Tax=Gossypium schwendimanii TaxID=34291 RepID=A0A7J9MQ74_GOSSC|nr:hypothetical protein [Gossypium schwendimanii]MBA0873204.1 hypothetical protein [Gossypium schwendimanii]